MTGAALLPFIAALAAAPDCPPEQLSCGKQVPVVSDGMRPFENHEMGLTAIFPAGSRVCLSRSGDAARGFYAWYGAAATGCPERGDIAATSMGLSSAFNASFDRTLVQAAPRDCRPLSANLTRRLRGAPLAIPGHRFRACQSAGPGGGVEITLYALAGKPLIEEDAPGVVYFAFLRTPSDPRDQDLAMFRTFLRQLQIGLER